MIIVDMNTLVEHYGKNNQTESGPNVKGLNGHLIVCGEIMKERRRIM
jgi:hypothetical protein